MKKLVCFALVFFSCVAEKQVCCQSAPQEIIRRSRTISPAKILKRVSFEDNAKATVSLSSGFLRGSGIFINREGDILTSLHLVPEGADPMHATWNVSDRTRSFTAESLYWDRRLDIMVLRSGTRAERYARLARSASVERSSAYVIGRRLGNGVVKLYGLYIGEAFPYAGAGVKVSNYLLPQARFASGGGIFLSGDNALIGISRLSVNESSHQVPASVATAGQIKVFLRCHHIDFEEID